MGALHALRAPQRAAGLRVRLDEYLRFGLEAGIFVRPSCRRGAMKGDFSRQTFRPGKHYSGVLMQQGRVQMDADWNEQQAINRHRVETAEPDVIGPSGAPKVDPGFGSRSRATICASAPGTSTSTACCARTSSDVLLHRAAEPAVGRTGDDCRRSRTVSTWPT